MENEETNRKILDLWKNNFEFIKEITDGKPTWPVLSPKFQKETILFLGINPSGEKKEEELGIKLVNELDDENKIKDLIEKERKNIWERGYSKYFKPMQDIAKKEKLPLNHFDLYFFRLRNSKKFIEILKKDKNQFFETQLNHSLSTIKKINPKIIFVANINASKIIKKEFNLVWNEEEGFHIAEIDNQKIPVFLSGMISSARYIDDSSLERLCWHIQKAKRWYEKNNTK